MSKIEDSLSTLRLACRMTTEALVELQTELKHADQPFSMDKVPARNEAFDLAEVDLLLREIKAITKPVHSLAHDLQDTLEERISDLMTVAELRRVPLGEHTAYPEPKRFLKMKSTYTDEALHAELAKLGLADVVQTTTSNGTLKGALLEYMRDNDLDDLPESLERFCEIVTKPSVTMRKV